MDMLLTGRAIDATEALDFGLTNRIVDPGKSRQAAMQLARDLVGFPQTCMRNDRLSAKQQFGSSEADAMGYEIRVGIESLKTDGTGGAAKFKDGAGRHGAFPPQP